MATKVKSSLQKYNGSFSLIFIKGFLMIGMKNWSIMENIWDKIQFHRVTKR